jgi:signal transduction histidine kinase
MSSAPRERAGRPFGLRLATWYAVVFLALGATIVGLTHALLSASLRQRDEEIVVSTLREYAARYDAGGLPALARAVEIEQRSGRHERLFVRVVGGGQEALFLSAPPEWGEFDVGRLDRPGGARGRALDRAPARDREAVLEVASLRLADGTLLQVGKSTETRDALLRTFRSAVGVVSLVVIGLGLAGGLVLTRWTLQPLQRLIDAVRQIIETGRTETRVPVRATGDAIDELSGLFNTMLDRITGLVTAMRDSLDHVAHDLRTPIARLRGLAERALDSDDPAAQRDALADCVEEADRIAAMLDTLTDISEAETGTMRLDLESVPVGALVDEVVDLYEDVAAERGVAVSVEVPASVRVRADGGRLRQVLANLVDNAIKYTPAGGRVRLSAAPDGDLVAIEVADTGVGISPEDLPRIWDRLYRGDRSRAERGLGLGLSIVRALVIAMGGRVSVRSETGHGSVFTVHLPA